MPILSLAAVTMLVLSLASSFFSFEAALARKNDLTPNAISLTKAVTKRDPLLTQT